MRPEFTEYSIYTQTKRAMSQQTLHGDRTTMKTSARLSHCAATLALLLAPATGSLLGQAATPATPAQATDTQDVQNLPPRAAAPSATPRNDTSDAWSMLTTSLDDIKHLDSRIQSLAALGLIENSPRAEKLIIDSMSDKDLDIRTAAVLAAGETKSRNMTTPLRNLLDDKEPQVAFAAATTLWKMKDRSGEDILMAVAGGERPANAKLVNGTMHTMNKDLHNPTALAKIGALQGASMLLGPFGIGITAYEYIRKNGGDSARAKAIDDLSEEHSELIRKQLLACLGDKDVAVRTAAAKALRDYRDPEVSKALAVVFDDPKLPTRLTAAAAYLVTTGPRAPVRAKK